MPKNVNCINIVITLEGVEKIQETEKKKMTTNQSDQSRGHASKLAREMRHNARQSDDNKQREMKEQHSGLVEWLHSYFSSAILEIRPNLVQDNEQYHTKVLHRSSHLNGGTQGFSPQISDLILRTTLYHVVNSTS